MEIARGNLGRQETACLLGHLRQSAECSWTQNYGQEKTWTLNKKCSLGRCGLSDSAHVLMLAGKKNEQNLEQPKLPLKIQYIESRLRNQEC